jgi:hypothetical protein
MDLGSDCSAGQPSDFAYSDVYEFSVNGRQAATDLESSSAELLSANLKSYQVGWAYVPSVGKYFCVVFEYD